MDILKRFKRAFRAFAHGDLKTAQRFDGARFNPSDAGTWAHVDNLSYDAANDSATRARIRSRARYVVVNNAYASGAAQAIANACVGTRPRLQLSASELPANVLSMIEADFMEWLDAVDLPAKLRAARFARFVDGETFLILFDNQDLKTSSGVRLDVQTIDAERVAGTVFDSPNEVDGITLNPYGYPVSYKILDQHPGAVSGLKSFGEATLYDASRVLHWYDKRFPEQHRGTSELSPALELFALIDRYSKAVVQASETAADVALIFKTDAVDDAGAYSIQPPQSGDSPFCQIPWARGMTITAPEGWDAKQVNAEQPSASYSMLVNEVLAQIGSALGVPKLLMKNSAENYNYSSARVDLQQFQIKTRLDRRSLVSTVLNPLFRAWLEEYSAIVGRSFNVRSEWYFDGFFHVDPLKEANASAARLNSLLSTLSDEWGARGLDWEQQLTEIAREKAFIAELEKKYNINLQSI